MRLPSLLALLTLAALAACTASPDDADPAPDATWRGLTIADEARCSPYDSDDYSYPQSVEPRIVEGMGGIIYGPYNRPPVRQHPGDRHRAHRRPLRGPRQRPLRRR